MNIRLLVTNLCDIAFQFSRDWFYSRLLLLTDDVMTDEERNEPKFKVHNSQAEPLPVAALTAVYQFQELLAKRGIEVLSHQRDGVVNKAILSYDLEERELLLVIATKTFLSFVKNEVFVSNYITNTIPLDPNYLVS